MPGWAASVLFIAIVTPILAFGGIAAGAAGMAKLLFFGLPVILLISLVLGLAGGRRVHSD
jgi:uncharacterized membrane protein YtjA (UPF0391 family)